MVNHKKANELQLYNQIKSLAMMVMRNTPARQRQKRGATARSEAKKQSTLVRRA